MYAIQNNSLFLGLYELVEECTSPPVQHLPHEADPRQIYGLEQLLVFKALQVGPRVHQSTS